MNILICIIWVNITIQASILGKNIIFEKNHWMRGKRQDGTAEDTTTVATPNETTISVTTITSELRHASKILIEGPKEELASLPMDQILKCLELVGDMDVIPHEHIEAIWDLVKNNRSTESLDLEDLKKMNGSLRFIPDEDLFYLNMSNWDLVEHVGKTRFEKHEVAILSSALTKANGMETLTQVKYLNRIFGLICGLDINILKGLPEKEINTFRNEIFQSLHACSKSKRRILLDMAIEPTILGPPQVWNAHTVKMANMLILALDIDELRSIRPPAMRGIQWFILDMMSREQISALRKSQISFLNEAAFLVYVKKIALRSKETYHKLNVSCNVLMFIPSLIYLVKEIYFNHV